jgi:hypothetical protein
MLTPPPGTRDSNGQVRLRWTRLAGCCMTQQRRRGQRRCQHRSQISQNRPCPNGSLRCQIIADSRVEGLWRISAPLDRQTTASQHGNADRHASGTTDEQAMFRVPSHRATLFPLRGPTMDHDSATETTKDERHLMPPAYRTLNRHVPSLAASALPSIKPPRVLDMKSQKPSITAGNPDLQTSLASFARQLLASPSRDTCSLTSASRALSSWDDAGHRSGWLSSSAVDRV